MPALSSVGTQVERSSCVGFVQVSRDALPVEASAPRVLGAQEEDEHNDRANDRYQSEEVTSAAAVRVVKTTPDQAEARHYRCDSPDERQRQVDAVPRAQS